MATNKKTWAISDDGQIDYRLLTPAYLNGALDVMRNGFFKHENVCLSVNLQNQPNAVKELEELCYHAAKDGLTVIAIDKTIDKVVGAAFNKLQVKTKEGEEPYFEKFAKNCKYAESRVLTEFMLKVDGMCDLFELTQTDCLLEVMFLATLPECRRKGIGERLVAVTIEVAEQLKNGVNVKQSLDENHLNLEPIPKLVTAICTTFITQKITKKLDFIKAVEDSYDLFEFNGRKFSEVVGKETPTFTLEYKRL